jgi:predicted alpha/beta-fold hydrolase
VAALDMRERWIYRQHVLGALKEGYAAIFARRGAALSLPPLAEARDIEHLRAWDDRIIAPRFGFRSAEHYYAEVSAGPRLARLGRPALLVEANDDPMILADTVRPTLREELPLLDVRWMEEGGHVGFPASLDLGLGGELGLEHQIVRWLRRAGSL